jgi:hypothetical protein
MKYLIFAVCLIFLLLFACVSKGTLEKVSPENDLNIEIYKYYFQNESLSGNDFVYISKFKNSDIKTLTWTEKQGGTTVTKGNILLYENNDIIVYKKEK